MDRSRIYITYWSAPNGHINKIKLTIIIVQWKYYIKSTIRTCLNSLLIIDWYMILKYGLIEATPACKTQKNVATPACNTVKTCLNSLLIRTLPANEMMC